MKRRMFLTLALAFAVIGPPAFAKTFADQVVEQLRAQGFGQITVERTLLGRTRIVAQGDEGRREIILNPRTGEILRDLWIGGSGSRADTGAGLIRDEDGGKGRGRGRGGDDDGDDADDDDTDGDSGGSGGSDDDDDSSGSGSNSGGGSGGDSGGGDDD